MPIRHLRFEYLSTTLVAGLFAGLALAPGASAQTLTDALIQAYQTSPLLQANQAALRGLDENIPQARSALRPQVSAFAGGEASTTAEAPELDRTERYTAALDASLLLFDNGETKAAVEAERNRIAAGRADLKDVEQFVLFNAVQAYVDVRRDEEFVRLANTDVERLDETLDATQNRFEVGEVTRTDVSQSQARLASSRSTLATAEGALEISREAYRAAIGSPPRDLQQLPPLPDLVATLEEATTIALQRNPLIIGAQFSERAAVYDFDRAMAAKGLNISVRGSAGARYLRQPFFDYDGDLFGEVGVDGNIPLYTGGRNSSLVRQAQALLDQRRFEVQDTARTVTQQTSAAWAELDVARVSIMARREQADASRIAAEGVAEEARLGARSTLDVLDAIQEQLEAEAEVVQALRDEYVAAYGLLRAMGLLTVQHLRLGIEPYDPDINFARVQSGPVGGYDTSVVDRIRARWEK